jgi:hypothetical protein
MPLMAKSKPKGGDAKPNPISYRPAADVARAMAEYRGRTKTKPAKAAVIDRALREFFRNEGIEIPLERTDAEEDD